MKFLRRLLKPLLRRIFSQTFLSSLAGEWYLFTVRRKLPRLRRFYASRRNLLLNIGTGGGGREGWINIDAYPCAGVNCLVDCRHELPFAGRSVRGIFSEHFLEHLRYPDEAGHFLKECLRVMQPGAVIRLIVPDCGAYLNAYASTGWKAISALRPLDEKRSEPGGHTYKTKMELVNEVLRQGEEHKFGYDFETLSLLMAEAGFVNVQLSRFGASLDPALLLDFEHRAPESLYVEAIAPPALRPA